MTILPLYTLNGHTPVQELDPVKWGVWMKNAKRHVAETRLNNARISTVFLGVDMNVHSSDHPLLFETMVFGGIIDGHQDRCSTWEEAEEMHKKAVRMVEFGDTYTAREIAESSPPYSQVEMNVIEVMTVSTGDTSSDSFSGGGGSFDGGGSSDDY